MVVITLLGNSTVNHILGTTYVDDGATAFDDLDGDLTNNITILNPVNNNLLGVYIVTYNVNNSNGVSATEVTRVVNVIDGIPLYGQAIDNLNPSHRYPLSLDVNDVINSNNGTDNNVSFNVTPISQDVSNGCVFNNISDSITLPDVPTINSVSQTKKSVCGWFMATSIQTPPRMIYNEGNVFSHFHFIYAYGNNSMFEVSNQGDNFVIQIFGPVLQPNRPYHFYGEFQGSGFSNECKFYVDGVRMELQIPLDAAPNTSTLKSRSSISFGDPITGEGIGGLQITLTASVNGIYNNWAMWDGSNSSLSDSDIRGVLFEQGSIPDVIINSGTESDMQTALNGEFNKVGVNLVSDIRIESVFGGGDLELNLNNRTFDPLSSIHIQYMGTGNLSIINLNGSNASIGSTPNGGLISFLTPTVVKISVIDALTNLPVVGARVLVSTDIGGPLQVGVGLISETTDSIGEVIFTFNFESNQPILGKVRRGSNPTFYKTAPFSGVITTSGLNQTVLIIPDE